jgi:hypothetical protein
MTTPSLDPGEAGGGGGGSGHLALGRAVLLVALAVFVGILLLHINSAPSEPGIPPVTGSTTTTTVHGATTTAPTVAVTPSTAIKVVVANGSTTTGAAGFYSKQLGNDGWSMLTPTNTTAKVTTSAVYYVAGKQNEAEKVATELGLKATIAQAVSTAVPVTSVTTADVIVVIGPDLGPQATAASTTTTAAGTTVTTTT